MNGAFDGAIGTSPIQGFALPTFVRSTRALAEMANAKKAAAPRVVPFAEADKALGGALSSAFHGRASSVLLVEGDCTIDTDLHRYLARADFKGVGLVAVKGNRVVKGRIALYDSYPGLWVGGHTTADTLEGVTWRVVRRRVLMQKKVDALIARGHEAEIVTQFSFDADSVLRWLEELRDRGIRAPVKIGVPGPISLPGLVHFAARSGVSASRSALAKYGTSLGKVIGTVGPLSFLERFAEGLVKREVGPIALHFFTFGALENTVEWVRATSSRMSSAR